MKAIVPLLVVAVAVAAAHPTGVNTVVGTPVPQPVGPAATTAAAAPKTGAPAVPTAGVAAVPGPRNWGPKVYGAGLRNPLAIPANPLIIQNALNFANLHPNILVRVNLDGEVELTNIYGEEVDLVTPLGFEIDI